MDLGQSFTFPLLFRGKWEIWTGSVTLTLCLMMNLSKQMIGHTVSQDCAWAHKSTHAHTKSVLTLAHAGNGSFVKGCLIYSKNHWENSMKKKTTQAAHDSVNGFITTALVFFILLWSMHSNLGNKGFISVCSFWYIINGSWSRNSR